MQHDGVLGPSFWLATGSSCCGLTLHLFLWTASIFLGSAKNKRNLKKLNTQPGTEGLRKGRCSVPHRDSALRTTEEQFYSWKALCEQNTRSTDQGLCWNQAVYRTRGLERKNTLTNSSLLVTHLPQWATSQRMALLLPCWDRWTAVTGHLSWYHWCPQGTDPSSTHCDMSVDRAMHFSPTTAPQLRGKKHCIPMNPVLGLI